MPSENHNKPSIISAEHCGIGHRVFGAPSNLSHICDIDILVPFASPVFLSSLIKPYPGKFAWANQCQISIAAVPTTKGASHRCATDHLRIVSERV